MGRKPLLLNITCFLLKCFHDVRNDKPEVQHDKPFHETDINEIEEQFIANKERSDSLNGSLSQLTFGG